MRRLLVCFALLASGPLRWALRRYVAEREQARSPAGVLLELFEDAKAKGGLGLEVSAFGLAAVLFAATTGVALFAQTPMGFTYEEMLDALEQLVDGSALA